MWVVLSYPCVLLPLKTQPISQPSRLLRQPEWFQGLLGQSVLQCLTKQQTKSMERMGPWLAPKHPKMGPSILINNSDGKPVIFNCGFKFWSPIQIRGFNLSHIYSHIVRVLSRLKNWAIFETTSQKLTVWSIWAGSNRNPESIRKLGILKGIA